MTNRSYPLFVVQASGSAAPDGLLPSEDYRSNAAKTVRMVGKV